MGLHPVELVLVKDSANSLRGPSCHGVWGHFFTLATVCWSVRIWNCFAKSRFFSWHLRETFFYQKKIKLGLERGAVRARQNVWVAVPCVSRRGFWCQSRCSQIVSTSVTTVRLLHIALPDPQGRWHSQGRRGGDKVLKGSRMGHPPNLLL